MTKRPCVIIGGGPTGLSVAWYLAQEGYKSVIIEKYTIGGCHRVNRVGDGVFTEHGPRLYTDAAVNFIRLLNEMGISFNKIFYKFEDISMTKELSTMNKYLSVFEMFSFASAAASLINNPSHGKNVSILSFMKENNFSHDAKMYIDFICRRTDGAGADRYSLYEFLQLGNQQSIYSLYQLRQSSDKILFPLWRSALLSTGLVEIVENTEALRIQKTKVELSGNREVEYSQLVLAIPPKNLDSLLTKSNMEYIFDVNIHDWAIRSSYQTYISATIHFGRVDVNVQDLHRNNSLTPWGVGYVWLRDGNDLILSVGASLLDVVSPHTRKTINQTPDVSELLFEMYRQILVDIPVFLPKPLKMTLSPTNHYVYDEIREENGKSYLYSINAWRSEEDSFIKAYNTDYLPMRSHVSNIYTAGTHTGACNYSMTSIETAVTNGKYLASSLCGVNPYILFTRERVRTT